MLNKPSGSVLNLSLKFIIGCSLILIISLGITFYVIAKREEKLILRHIENEARIIHRQVIITREWLVSHKGIYVETAPSVSTNPDIKKIPIETTDKSGRKFTRETPGILARELSRYTKNKGNYWFKMTSLKLVNPENAPDTLEKDALLRFENNLNIKELISLETINKSKYMRYIAPVYIETGCLPCHAWQGYKIGDVRGAISITIPIDKHLAEISTNRKNMLTAGILTLAALMTAMFLMIKRLVLTPMQRLKLSIKKFSEGSYSPNDIVRTGDEFESLSQSFSKMAKSLMDYHSSLNEKVRTATAGLEEANQKLLEANSLLNETNLRKSDFIARASHELRTPLTSIKGAMDYISARLQLIDPQQDDGQNAINDLCTFLEVIKKNSERLVRLVNDMLDLERIELGVSEFHFINLNLSTLIHEVVTYLQPGIDSKHITFKIKAPEALRVCADEDRLRQVFINLISNAAKFSPPESEILIDAFSEENYIATEIHDRGRGVLPDEQEKIFDKFYKSGSREGTGLGLAISKSIIEAHDGIIGVNSDGKNGSCFYFKLPKTRKREEDNDANTCLCEENTAVLEKGAT
ncbi:MAG: DUF3365 domain-containing protein [Nitrospirae bacterium]|nr:DUF3365 domain-containing protein [Nitrospirota bacterium]